MRQASRQRETKVMASPSKFVALMLLAAAVSACTTKKVEPPAPSGPSELATSLSLSATPDTITQDGQSTSQITIFARDANGQPLRSLSLRADIMVNNVITDFGSLSIKNFATGNDGRAVTVYTAPRNVDSVDRQTRVTIAVTPVGGDARGDLARQVDIRLVPPGVVGGGLTAVPDFEISPETPSQLETVLFNAADPDLDGKLTAYAWNFGDGSQGSGRTTSHAYRDAGNYSVTLTVTDVTNATGSRSKTVQVGASELPVANFVFSPTEPGIGQEIVFNGSGSTATAPRSIVELQVAVRHRPDRNRDDRDEEVRHARDLQRHPHGDRRCRKPGNRVAGSRSRSRQRRRPERALHVLARRADFRGLGELQRYDLDQRRSNRELQVELRRRRIPDDGFRHDLACVRRSRRVTWSR